MSLAAQFYARDILQSRDGPAAPRATRRPLYADVQASSSPTRGSGGSTQQLLANYRGAGMTSVADVHPSYYEGEFHNEDALMTDAERAAFAHELSTLERQAETARAQRSGDTRRYDDEHTNQYQHAGGGAVEIQMHQRRPHGAQPIQHHSSSLGEHFDPQLLSDTSIPSNFFPHARARQAAEDAAARPPSKSDTFFYKNEQWRDHVKLKNEILRNEFRAQADGECTFKPSINRPSSPTASSRHLQRSAADDGFNDEGGDAPRREGHQRFVEMDVRERLMQFEAQRKQRLKSRAHEIQLAQEEECKFRPRTNIDESGTVSAKYLDPRPSPKLTTITSFNRPEGDGGGRSRSASNASGHDGLHHPTTTRIPDSDSAKLASYLHKPVHERLHDSAMTQQERRRREHERRQIAFARRPGQSLRSLALTTEAPSYVIGESTLSAIGDATALESSLNTTGASRRLGGGVSLDAGQPGAPQEVVDPAIARLAARLEVDAKQREASLVKIRDESMVGYTFQPVTAVYRRPRDAPQRVDPKVPPQPTSFSFAPKVDKASALFVERRYKKRTVDHLLKYKEDHAQRLQRQQEERDREAEGAAGAEEQQMGTPKISKFAQQVEGKIASNIRTSEDYKRFLAMQRRIRQRDIELFVRQRDEAEDAELTFRPQIHAAPSYISEIVKELRESRQATSRSRSRSQL